MNLATCLPKPSEDPVFRFQGLAKYGLSPEVENAAAYEKSPNKSLETVPSVSFSYEALSYIR